MVRDKLKPDQHSPKSAGRRGKRKGKQSLPPLAALEPCRFDESASSANCRFTNGGRTVEIVGEGTALAERDATDEGDKLYMPIDDPYKPVYASYMPIYA